MTLTEALNEQMKDESFKKEYDALGPEYEIISCFPCIGKECSVSSKDTDNKFLYPSTYSRF